MACHYLLIYRKSHHCWSRHCQNHVAPCFQFFHSACCNTFGYWFFFFTLKFFFVSEYFVVIVILNNFGYNWTWFLSRLPWLTDTMASFYVVGCNICIQVLFSCFHNYIICFFVPNQDWKFDFWNKVEQCLSCW